MSDFPFDLFQDFKKGIEEARAERERRNKLLSYWPKFFPNTSFSPKEFYTLVLKHLEESKIPNLEVGGVLMRQSGVLSSRRLYLHLRREQLVFEICGFPFGTGFFVSSRLFDRRRDAGWFHFLFASIILGALGVGALTRFDLAWAVVVVSGFVCLAWSLMRLADCALFVKLDHGLVELPLLGPIYEHFFHPETYYRQDTNNAYRDAVHDALMHSVDDFTKGKGMKPISDEERRPILRDLYRK